MLETNKNSGRDGNEKLETITVVRRRVSGLTVTAEMRRYVRGEHANTVDTHHHFG